MIISEPARGKRGYISDAYEDWFSMGLQWVYDGFCGIRKECLYLKKNMFFPLFLQMRDKD